MITQLLNHGAENALIGKDLAHTAINILSSTIYHCYSADIKRFTLH